MVYCVRTEPSDIVDPHWFQCGGSGSGSRILGQMQNADPDAGPDPDPGF